MKIKFIHIGKNINVSIDKYLIICVLIYSIVLLKAFTVHGQSKIAITPFDFDKLNNFSIVFCLDQDEYGNIWAATEEGLIRYNSHDLYLYNEYDGLPSTFSNRINKVFVDSKETIWIVSDNSIGRFNFDTNKVEEVEFEGTPDFRLIYSIEEHKNSIFLGCYNGLWKLSRAQDGKYQCKQFLAGNPVRYIDSAGDYLWVSTSSSSYRIKSNNEPKLISNSHSVSSVLFHDDSYFVGDLEGNFLEWDETDKSLNNILQLGSPIFDIVFTPSDQKIYVATDGSGLFALSLKLEILKNYKQNSDLQTGLRSNGIYDLHLDDQDQLWIATYGGGVHKLKTNPNVFTNIRHVLGEEQSLSNSFTRAIKKMSNGDIWFGTKEGISILNTSNKKWRHLRNLNGKKSQSEIVMALQEDGDFVWAGTYGDGAFKINKTTLKTEHYNTDKGGLHFLPINKVYSILVDSFGNKWFGGIGANLQKMSLDNSFIEYNIGQVRDIIEGENGVIYTAGRLGVHSIENGEISLLDLNAVSNVDLDFSTINCLFLEENHLWIGTNGDGILDYNLNDKSVKSLNMENGLPSDIIQGIIPYEDGLWLSTTRGLVFIKKNQLSKVEVFDIGDGMESSSFNYGSYARIADDQIAFGSNDGVVAFNPLEVLKEKLAPILIFESIELLSGVKENDPSLISLSPIKNQPIALKHYQNVFKIKFAGVDQLFPEKVMYSWMLDGVSNDWSAPKQDNEINFAGVLPGKYTFKVKALNRDGVSGDERFFEIHIDSPWWNSKFAYFIYFILAIIMALLAFKMAKLFLSQQNAKEQVSFYNNITHELKTPLSILFSKLDSVSSEDTMIKDVKSTVKRINSLFDQLLNFNKVNSEYYKNQKISKITFSKHLNLIAKAFTEELKKKDLSLNIENQWPDEHLYYKRDVLDKITYNLLSNAIKYSKRKGTVHLIASSINDNQLKIEVSDNGIGIPETQQKDILKRYYRASNAVNSQLPGTGLGLMIVKNLVEFDGGKIYFKSEEGVGSTFSVELKNLKNKYVSESPVSIDLGTMEQNKQTEKLTKLKILVVEDNDELRIDLVEKLSKYYSILAAKNGVEGLEKAKSKLPDLIITDLIMPEMNGNELCIELQKDEDTNHIPVFMMSVLNNSTQKVESIKSGITSYMPKPLDFELLIAKINGTLGYKQKLRDKFLLETDIEQAHNFKNTRDAEFIANIQEFIISKVHEENLSVQDLCRHVVMSRTALYTKLKAMIDQSPQSFIITTRMDHAKKLLLKGGATVKEVAYAVGFSNPKYFSTSFKKQYGISPSGFLKSLNPKD